MTSMKQLGQTQSPREEEILQRMNNETGTYIMAMDDRIFLMLIKPSLYQSLRN